MRRLTEDKVLKAELRVTTDVSDRRRQVILYDKQLNINSAVTKRRVTFTEAAGQSLCHRLLYIETLRCAC